MISATNQITALHWQSYNQEKIILWGQAFGIDKKVNTEGLTPAIPRLKNLSVKVEPIIISGEIP